MPYQLPALPYDYASLEPFLDTQTMEIHHKKHHQTYVDKLNEALVKNPLLAEKEIKELLKDNLKLVSEEIKTAVKNHGGGHFNHSFFWKILSPKKQEPSKKFDEIISKDFISTDKFKEVFSNAALTRFGSGWAWLVYNPSTKKLEVYNTLNQDCPISEGKIPLLTIDVWEHAYYLKYQNKRADYIKAFWNIVNWEKVEELYKQAIA